MNSIDCLEHAARCADTAKFCVRKVRESHDHGIPGRDFPMKQEWLKEAFKWQRLADYWSLEAERPRLGMQLLGQEVAP